MATLGLLCARVKTKIKRRCKNVGSSNPKLTGIPTSATLHKGPQLRISVLSLTEETAFCNQLVTSAFTQNLKGFYNCGFLGDLASSFILWHFEHIPSET